MRITYKGDYALKIILDLAEHYYSEKKLVQMKEISKRQDIPLKYLEQIVLVLKGAGYIRSRRGPEGGLILSRPPEKIKVGEIIRLMDGTTSPITCISKTEPSKCRDIDRCPFVDMWLDIRNYTNKIVDNTTFADLVKKLEEKISKKTLDYVI